MKKETYFIEGTVEDMSVGGMREVARMSMTQVRIGRYLGTSALHSICELGLCS